VTVSAHRWTQVCWSARQLLPTPPDRSNFFWVLGKSLIPCSKQKYFLLGIADGIPHQHETVE